MPFWQTTKLCVFKLKRGSELQIVMVVPSFKIGHRGFGNERIDY